MCRSFKLLSKVWINYMRDKGKKVQQGKLRIAPPSKQLIADLIGTGIAQRKSIISVHITSSYNNKLNGTNDHTIYDSEQIWK